MNRFFKTPSVELTFDKKKNYTPKYKVTFFLESSTSKKLYSLGGPLVLVAALTTLNVLMGSETGGPALDNTIGLALTTVFLMPEIDGGSSRDDEDTPWYKMTDELFMVFMFVGMTLAAIIAPKGYDESEDVEEPWKWPFKFVNWVGIAFIWIAILILPMNLWKRGRLKRVCTYFEVCLFVAVMVISVQCSCLVCVWASDYVFSPNLRVF